MKGVGRSLLLLIFPLIIVACQHHRSKPEIATIDLRRGNLLLCGSGEFGEVSFSSSCKPETQKDFELAVSLLHSFEYDEAEKAFVKVIDADPECAMAYWGVAMSIFHTLWAPPDEEQLKKGAALLQAATSIPKSDREKAYLDAIGVYFKDWDKIDATTRAAKFTQKMEETYQQYPDDKEAAIFYALALNATADPADKGYRNQRKAGNILEAIFSEQPNHPGIAHYIIHSYDNPVLAKKALPTARKYAQIAPGSAHAQHMPSHIFTRLGLWDESIASNLKSISSAVCYAEQSGFEGHWDEELHGLDYLVYAYLQKGDNQKASEENQYLGSIQKVYPVNFKDAYAIAAIPARIALENKNWQQAAGLELSTIDFPWQQFPWQKAILHFTRALGAAHLGDETQANREIATLQSLHDELIDSGNQYQANQVMIQLKAAQAWLKFAQSKNDDAIALMGEAAMMEENSEKHPVTPCEVIPARELFGDLLLALSRPAEALEAYKTDLQFHPQRFNGVYGAAVAASRSGKPEVAKEYFGLLLKQAEAGSSQRPEIMEAKAFLRNS